MEFSGELIKHLVFSFPNAAEHIQVVDKLLAMVPENDKRKKVSYAARMLGLMSDLDKRLVASADDHNRIIADPNYMNAKSLLRADAALRAHLADKGGLGDALRSVASLQKLQADAAATIEATKDAAMSIARDKLKEVMQGYRTTAGGATTAGALWHDGLKENSTMENIIRHAHSTLLAQRGNYARGAEDITAHIHNFESCASIFDAAPEDSLIAEAAELSYRLYVSNAEGLLVTLFGSTTDRSALKTKTHGIQKALAPTGAQWGDIRPEIKARAASALRMEKKR